MDTSHSKRNILIALLILAAVGAAGYFYTTRDRTSETDLLVGTPAGDVGGAVDGDLLSALGQLRRITLDDSVFDDPIFKSFTDYSTTIVPQPSGRSNPFAPIEGATSTQAR